LFVTWGVYVALAGAKCARCIRPVVVGKVII
jgi:hypothetical protein